MRPVEPVIRASCSILLGETSVSGTNRPFAGAARASSETARSVKEFWRRGDYSQICCSIIFRRARLKPSCAVADFNNRKVVLSQLTRLSVVKSCAPLIAINEKHVWHGEASEANKYDLHDRLFQNERLCCLQNTKAYQCCYNYHG